MAVFHFATNTRETLFDIGAFLYMVHLAKHEHMRLCPDSPLIKRPKDPLVSYSHDELSEPEDLSRFGNDWSVDPSSFVLNGSLWAGKTGILDGVLEIWGALPSEFVRSEGAKRQAFIHALHYYHQDELSPLGLVVFDTYDKTEFYQDIRSLPDDPDEAKKRLPEIPKEYLHRTMQIRAKGSFPNADIVINIANGQDLQAPESYSRKYSPDLRTLIRGDLRDAFDIDARGRETRFFQIEIDNRILQIPGFADFVVDFFARSGFMYIAPEELTDQRFITPDRETSEAAAIRAQLASLMITPQKLNEVIKPLFTLFKQQEP